MVSKLMKLNTPSREDKMEHECTKLAIYDGDLCCTECFAVQTRFVNPVISYSAPNTPNLTYFNTKYVEVFDKYSFPMNYDRLLQDFTDFRDAFHRLNFNRKNLIKFELIVCFLSRKQGVDCYIHHFDELKTLHTYWQNKNVKKLDILVICWQVLHYLGWNKHFYLCNKETMEQLNFKIKQFVESLGDDQRAEEMVLSVERAVLPYFFTECDTKANGCIFIFKRGKSKGETCGKPCKENYCPRHSRRMFKEIECDNLKE